MISVTRRFTIAAGHRLPNHSGKCREMHGHNYAIEVTLRRDQGDMNADGMVIDFARFKETIGVWLDTNWDHTLIVSAHDPRLSDIAAWKAYTMDGAPTAENMAHYLLRTVCPSVLPVGVVASCVKIWETENCCATAEL